MLCDKVLGFKQYPNIAVHKYYCGIAI